MTTFCGGGTSLVSHSAKHRLRPPASDPYPTACQMSATTSAAAPPPPPTAAASRRGERLKEGSKEHDVRTANIIAGAWRLHFPANACVGVNAQRVFTAFLRALPAPSHRAFPRLSKRFDLIHVKLCSQGRCGRCAHVTGPARHGQDDSVPGRRCYRHQRRRHHLEVHCVCYWAPVTLLGGRIAPRNRPVFPLIRATG